MPEPRERSLTPDVDVLRAVASANARRMVEMSHTDVAGALARYVLDIGSRLGLIESQGVAGQEERRCFNCGKPEQQRDLHPVGECWADPADAAIEWTFCPFCSGRLPPVSAQPSGASPQAEDHDRSGGWTRVVPSVSNGAPEAEQQKDADEGGRDWAERLVTKYDRASYQTHEMHAEVRRALLKALRAASEPQQQEPVAWGVEGRSERGRKVGLAWFLEDVDFEERDAQGRAQRFRERNPSSEFRVVPLYRAGTQGKQMGGEV